MKTKALILILFAGGCLLNACQKDIDIFTPNPGQINGPDTTWQSTVTPTMPVSNLRNNLLEAPYLDSINVNATAVSIITPAGRQVNFPPNCCTNAAGQPVTGKVLVEVQLVNKKGDMIRQNKPSTYNDSLLVTAGQIFIKLKKNGEALQLAPNIKLNIRHVDLPLNAQMAFFVGDETNQTSFNWLSNPDTGNNKVFVGTQAYEINSNQLRWISLAYKYDLSSNPYTTVTANIASHFTNANTIAFTVLKDFRSVVAMRGDVHTQKFVSTDLPANKQFTLVVISKIGDDYYLGYESAVTQTPATNPTTQNVQVVPIKKSFPEILSYLRTL